MELRELGDRLFRLHAKLIIGAFLVGLLGGLAVYLTAKPQYQASTTLVMGAQDPQSAEEAAVLADTARGIATGPQLVSKAISGTRATRNEQAVAAAIHVQALGNSGVLTLSVTDSNPRVAVRLANGLTARAGEHPHRPDRKRPGVVPARPGSAGSVHGCPDPQAQHADTDPGRADRHPFAPADGQALTQLAQLQARLTSLQQEAIQIAVQRNQLLAQQGTRRPRCSDRATSATRVRGRGLINALLGGILGLIVGIALAGAREMLRPSLVGAHAISRAIGTPLLGEVNTRPDNWTMATLPDAGTYVELAADAQHMYEVRFAALEPGKRSGSRVRMLEGPLHKLRFGQSPTTSPGAGTGLVVAIPRVLKLADVDALTNFIWISGWTLLGVIVYSPSKKPAKAATAHPSPAASPQESSPRRARGGRCMSAPAQCRVSVSRSPAPRYAGRRWTPSPRCSPRAG